MEACDRTVSGTVGDYVSQPADYDFFYAPPSSWTPINRPVTPGAPNSQSQGLQQVVFQTPITVPTPVTPPAPNRARKRVRKRNIDACPQKDNEITKAKPSKKKTRSSANNKRLNKSDPSKRIEDARATKPDATADQSRVLPGVGSGTPCNPESNIASNIKWSTPVDMPGSEPTKKNAKQTTSQACLSTAGPIDHHHRPVHQPTIDLTSSATLLNTEDNCEEYDEFLNSRLDDDNQLFNSLLDDDDQLLNSLLDDAIDSSVIFVGSRASSHSTYCSPIVRSSPDAKTGCSDLEHVAHMFSSPSTVGLDSQMSANSADPDFVDSLDKENLSCAKNHLRKFSSPVTLKTGCSVETIARPPVDRKPIVRFPFPPPICNRSPIIGLSPSLLLRTCFRIGEAINQASHATKNRQKVVFELYARIMDSHRDEEKQDFVFCDLFHEKPPHLRGIYSAAIWKDVDLYRYDGARLLTKDRMCRCIGEIKRDGKEWVMAVSNVWEATWEDIEWVEGIINAV